MNLKRYFKIPKYLNVKNLKRTETGITWRSFKKRFEIGAKKIWVQIPNL